MQTKLQIAKQLRAEHGSITYFDATIYFQDGKFWESFFASDGELIRIKLNWQRVLKAIKSGYWR